MKDIYKLRNTGIETIGYVPWGTHFCQFYLTKQDLLDILVPFFKTGFKNNEFCVWVTSEFLNTKEATTALRKGIPGFDKYLKKGQIEIFPHTEMKRVLKDWVAKYDSALSRGFSGTRVSGNPFWLESKKDRSDFAKYEAAINKVIDAYKLLVLCTYSLKKCGTGEVIDVVSNHEFALIKRRGKWENIETVAHKKLEQSLHQSEERFKQFIRLSGHLGWTTNARGEVEEDVPFWRNYTGQSYKQVKGCGWSNALHPDDLERTLKLWKKSVANKNPYETEYRIQRHDGVYRQFFIRGIPVFKDSGEVQEWLGACIDITERKKVEEELVKRAAQLENLNRSLQAELVKETALLENIGDGVIAVNKKGRIITLNKKTEDIFGWKAQNMTGKLFYNRFQLENAEGKLIPTQLRPIRLALDTGKVIHGIYFLIRAKAKPLPLFITSSPIILKGKTVGAVTVYRDVSQQIAIEQAKDEFISIASHELRTPLSATSWSLEQLYEDSKNLTAVQRKSLDQINKQTERMIVLTNDLLAVTKMDLDIFSYKYEEVDPTKIASDVIEALKFQIKEKSIRLTTNFDSDIKSFRTYSNTVHIILHNLLSNAIKFTYKDGKITLKMLTLQNNLIMQVSDSGLGIPKADLSKIFQKMYRGANVKGKVEGSGLGLYITKSMVDHMGGKITVVSEHNEGTTFTVSLPLGKEEGEEKKIFADNSIGQISLSL